MISIIITIVSGMVCQYELDDDLSESWNFAPQTKTGTLIFVMALNLFTVFYGLSALIFNTIALKLQAIIQSSGELSVDGSAKNFDWVVRKTFRGMNPVGYFTRNGRHFIDVSKLDEGERKFLVLSLTETMSACFDSGSKIHTWLLENAIHEAFVRAMQARSALVRHLYETHGGRSFALFNIFGFVKLFRVNVRPPDIPTSTAAEEGKHDDSPKGRQDSPKVLRNKNRGKSKRGQDETKIKGYSMLRTFKRSGEVETEGVALGGEHSSGVCGVTVEELHNALSSVNVDVLERHPNIHRRMTAKPVAQEKPEDTGKLDHYALTWNPGASLAVFEDFAKTWGSLEIDKNMKRYNDKRAPDADLVRGMERERELYRGSSAYALKERELEESYAMMQEEILTLKLILQEAEAADSGLPMLADSAPKSLADSVLSNRLADNVRASDVNVHQTSQLDILDGEDDNVPPLAASDVVLNQKTPPEKEASASGERNTTSAQPFIGSGVSETPIVSLPREGRYGLTTDDKSLREISKDNPEETSEESGLALTAEETAILERRSPNSELIPKETATNEISREI